MGLFDRLTELTRIQNDFEDELQRQPRAKPGSSILASTKRTKQLTDDQQRVQAARGDEIGRLLNAGHTAGELRGHLDRTDRNRNR